MATGRFAPSPTGELHLGNLRTALIAWLFARSSGSRFVVRVEDLDRVASSAEFEAGQLADLAAIGLDWDGHVLRQSERFPVYQRALERLADHGLLYPCYCTRREVREAASAPHGDLPEGAYPGTCRDLDPAERSAREAAGRPAALRLDAHGARRRVQDLFHGEVEAVVDDFVVRRNDGVAAYNLAVVVDDADQGIEQVVRGDDLLLGTPRQALLCDLLELPVPAYAHVPLVLGPSGERLAKRDGAVTLADRRALGESAGAVCGLLAASLGLSEPGEAVHPRELIARFDPAALPRTPWLFDHPAPVHRNGGLTPD